MFGDVGRRRVVACLTLTGGTFWSFFFNVGCSVAGLARVGSGPTHRARVTLVNAKWTLVNQAWHHRSTEFSVPNTNTVALSKKKKTPTQLRPQKKKETKEKKRAQLRQQVNGWKASEPCVNP